MFLLKGSDSVQQSRRAMYVYVFGTAARQQHLPQVVHAQSRAADPALPCFSLRYLCYCFLCTYTLCCHQNLLQLILYFLSWKSRQATSSILSACYNKINNKKIHEFLLFINVNAVVNCLITDVKCFHLKFQVFHEGNYLFFYIVRTWN